MPSGLTISLQEYFVDTQPDGARLARFRFVAPGLQGVSFARVEQDFPVLCAGVAVPYLSSAAADVAAVVISVASEAVEFGESDPSVIQYFEAFRVENGLCIWEGF